MISFLIGFIFMIFDVEIGSDQIRLDLLPDYVGFGFMIFGIYKMRRNAKTNDAFLVSSKQAMIACIISFILSYVICLFDMFGITNRVGNLFSLVELIISDLVYLLAAFMFIEMIKALQGTAINFQVKRMMMLLEFQFLCLMCVDASVGFGLAEMMISFAIFEKIIGILFLIYVYTSNKTYKEKYLKNL